MLRCALFVLLLPLLLVAMPQNAIASPYEAGTLRLSVVAGYGTTFDQGYLIAGAGIGYFLIDGLVAHTNYEGWFLSTPRIHKLSPGLEYVFHMVPTVQPYAGAFYRYWIRSDDFDNFSTLGGRLGLYLGGSGPVLFSVGAVHERVLGSCEIGCTATYPEFRLSFSL